MNLNRWSKIVDSAAWSDRYGHSATVANGYIYIAGGVVAGVRVNDVWRSADGINWEVVTNSAAWSSRYGPGFLFYDNKFWIFGGSPDSGIPYNDVWSSDDAVTWTQVTASASWGIRHQFGYCIHNNRMYIAGGYNGGGSSFYSDVYSSSDGLNWTLETANFGTTLRQCFLISFLGDLWLYDGQAGSAGSHSGNFVIRCSQDNGTTWSSLGNAPFSDTTDRAIVNNAGNQLVVLQISSVWTSPDGINFTQVTQIAARSARSEFALVNFHDNAHLIGGLLGAVYYNDVWKETYTVTYNGNGGSPAPVDSNFYNPGDTATVMEPGSLARFAYTFNNWNTVANGTGTTYNPGDTFAITTLHTLYAQWTLYPLSGIFYVEATGDGVYPYDTRQKAATNLTNLFYTVPSEAWQPNWIVYVFGTVYEPNDWNNFTATGVKIIGENPQTTIVEISSCYFEEVSLYNITFNVSDSDAEWTTICYDPDEVINCKFNGGGYAYSAITIYSGKPIKFVGNSFRNFFDDAYAIYTSDNGLFEEVLIINNSFENCNLYLEFYDTTIDVVEIYNNTMRNGVFTIDISYDAIITNFVHDHNICTGGFNYITFSPDVTETTSDPLYLEISPNELAIDNTSPAYHAGITRSTSPLTDLLGIAFANPPSIGAYEVASPALQVLYDGNGNVSGTVPVDSNVYQEGDAVTVLGNTGSLSKTDLIFSGWNTQASGAGIHYDPSGTFLMPATSLTLYAEWRLQVTYNGNDNTGGTAPIDVNYYLPYGVITTLNNTGSLSRTGYRFNGWNTQANGQGTHYELGQEFITTLNLTLYAEWIAVFSVQYFGNGSTGGTVPVDSNTYAIGEETIVLSSGSLSRTGYIFNVWNTLPDGTGTSYSPLFPLLIAGNTSLYAQWLSSEGDYPVFQWMVPECSITLPTDGQVFIQIPPFGLQINAIASSNVTDVQYVEFFVDDGSGPVKVGEDFTAPYSCVATITASGSYILTVRATNELNITGVSEPITIEVIGAVYPTCEIIEPEEGHVFDTSPTDVEILVDAQTLSGTITLVEFFMDSGSGPVKVGEQTTPHTGTIYRFVVEDVVNGNYTLTARATNSYALSFTSLPVNFEVRGNVPPVCEITEPTTGMTFAKDSSIFVRAVATDTDGTIVKVEFFADGIKVGEDTLLPYTHVIHNLEVGTHILTAIATDNRGDISVPQFPVTIYITDLTKPPNDRIPPITISDIPVEWNRHKNFVVELVANDFANTEHDIPAGLLRTYYTTDGSEPTTLSSYGPTEPDNKTTRFEILNRQGPITIKYFSVDLIRQAEGLGYTERTKTDILRLDDVPPITTYSAAPPDGSNGWYKTNPTITLIATDESSGVYRTFYRLNSGTFQEYTTPFMLPEQGVHTLQCFSEDNAGNVEDVKTFFFKCDAEPPFTQDDIILGLHTEPVTINFYTSDLHSGTDKTYFTLDGSTPTTSSPSGSSVVISTSGTYTVRYFSVDVAGNAEIVRSNQIEVFIDTEGPGTYVFESFHINGKSGWYTESPDISIVAIDPSGVKEIQYKLSEVGKTTTAKYTSTVDISSTVDLSVNHYVKLEIDQSGNPLEVDIAGVIPSQTTITEIISAINAITGQTIATETNSSGETGNSYITLTSPTAGTANASSEIKFLAVLSNDATNEVFGLDETAYPHTFTETVVFIPYVAPFILPSDNYWNLEYYSVDNENNQSPTGTKNYKLDSEPPITTVSSSYDPDGTNGWYVTPPEPGQQGGPEITLEATDNLSGVEKIYYKWNVGHWEEFKAGDKIYIPGEGQHVLRFYAVDYAGNEEIENQAIFKYDYSAPVTTDDTIKYQGIIYTARGSGHQQVPEENPVIIGPYNLRLRNKDIVAVPYCYNVTKSQEYILEEILGTDRDVIQVLPVVRNENSSRLDEFRIQLLGLGGSPLIDFYHIYRIHNKTKGITYTVDFASSTLAGNLVLQGIEGIDLGDILSVDYSFSGVPFSAGDIVNVSYAFDISHDPQVLNSIDYRLIDPYNPPYTNDYDLTVHLLPTDAISSIAHTFYTTDGSEPTINSLEGTSIDFTEPGTYTIKYFSIDAAGNVETPHEAQYQIRIDKRIPQLHIDFDLDPLEDGENGWFKYNFGLNVQLWSEDRIDRIDEEPTILSETEVLPGIWEYELRLNNRFVNNVSRIRTSITDKSYTFDRFELNEASCDKVFVRGSERHVPVKVIVTPQILHIHNPEKLDYLYDVPIIGTLIIRRNGIPTTNFVLEGSRITITESMVDTDVYDATYSVYDRMLVDYRHYIGLEKVNFGLDSSELSTEVLLSPSGLRADVLANNRVNYAVTFLRTSSQFYSIDGQRTIYARAYDSNTVLNTGAPQKQSLLYVLPYKLDRVAPVTTDNIPGPGWLKAPVNIELFPFDAMPGSGVSATHYTTNGLTPTRTSQNSTYIQLDSSGIYNIKYFSVDFAGNSEAVKTGLNLVSVDADPPLTSIVVSPVVPDGNNYWYRTQPTISFTSIDSFSGVDQTFYRLNDGLFYEYTAPFLLPEGAITITYYSIDNVGNIETSKIAVIKYDATAPETTTDAPVGYTSQSRINFLVTDVGSGTYRTYYTTDGTDPTQSSAYGTYVDLLTSGTYTLKYFSVDNAGNIETIKTQIVQIDLEEPEIYEFQPAGCIITDTTTEIVVKIRDALSGVDIDSVIIDVDGVVYSTTKNASYFSYAGTAADYTITISPITGLLNFQDVELLKVRNVTDFAGNVAPTLEFNLVTPDVLSPWVREVYPAPNVQDVSTATNVIAFIDDSQSGVNIKSVNVTINSIEFKINSKNILRIQYTGVCTTATLQIFNRSLVTYIDSVKDVSISFNETDRNTIKKVELYLNSLPNYEVTILDSRYEQTESIYLLNISSLNIVDPGVVDFYLPEENLNFSFFERGKGYLVFASPSFNFEHKVTVNVSINAEDNAGNIMDTFTYAFVPHIYATPSIKKRNYLNRVALDYLSDMQANMASNYSRSKSTNFYGHQKAICLELARHLEEIEHLNEDRSYTTLRSSNLYSKLGYLLETLPQVDMSHDDYRRLLQSLISILFKGSLKSSIEQGVSLFLGTDVKIVEVVFAEGTDISEQFVFTADIMITDTFTGVDLIALSKNLSHVFNLVKPAHVFIVQRFGWVEEFDFQAGCTLLWEVDEFGDYVINQFGNRIPRIAFDGYQAAETQSDTAICDRFKYSFNSRFEEDVRQDCAESLERVNTYIEEVTSQFTGAENYFYIHRIPILHDGTHVAEFADVTVTVNGTPVQILELDPLTGFVRISVTPAAYEPVFVTYKYNKYFIYRVVTMYLDGCGISYQHWIQHRIESFFGGGSQYFDILETELDEFIVSDGETGFEIEKRSSLTTRQVVGRIKIPDVEMHAHVCDTNYNNVSTTREDFKEPLMLNEVAKWYSPESGHVPNPEISFTYLNDKNFILNGVSIINKKCLNHDTYTMTLMS
jgi:hypothetical protein